MEAEYLLTLVGSEVKLLLLLLQQQVSSAAVTTNFSRVTWHMCSMTHR